GLSVIRSYMGPSFRRGAARAARQSAQLFGMVGACLRCSVWRPNLREPAGFYRLPAGATPFARPTNDEIKRRVGTKTAPAYLQRPERLCHVQPRPRVSARRLSRLRLATGGN